MKVGGNDPCPCGSGRKYRNCCLEDQGSGLPHEGPAGVFAEIRQALQGQRFSSLEELRFFTDRFMRQRNQASLDDFQGLSPERMHRILAFPFDSPDLVTYALLVSPDSSAPTPYFTPEKTVRSCDSHRTLVNFAAFLGLAEVEPTTKEPYDRLYRVRKRPLLAEALAGGRPTPA